MSRAPIKGALLVNLTQSNAFRALPYGERRRKSVEDLLLNKHASMDTNGPDVPLRRPTAGYKFSRAYMWEDDAACKNEDPSLFIIDPPTVEEMGFKPTPQGWAYIKYHTGLQVKKAQSVCQGCPVKGGCLSSAEPSDLFWSVRGGEEPGIMKKWARRNVVPSFKADDYLPRECPKGHSEWTTIPRKFKGADGTMNTYDARVCLPCKREEGAKKRAKRREKNGSHLV